MITDLKPGDAIVAYFVLRKKEMRTSRESDEFYAALELGDASGRISGTLWTDARKFYDKVAAGDILKVKGKVIDYKNRKHLHIEKVRKASKTDDVKEAELVPKVDKDISALLAELDATIAQVGQEELQRLLHLIFQDGEFRQSFARAPGGKLWHHNYVGGLLEHTLSVTRIAVGVAASYPNLNTDLLRSAGLLHDIGKVTSYKYKTYIDYTDEGRLLGHIVIGAQMVTERIKEIPAFSKELAKQLMHLILSHQGKLEQASPVVPMTLEGIVLYYADEIDSKANAFQRIKKRDGGRKWSSYVSLMNQYFYFGPESPSEGEVE